MQQPKVSVIVPAYNEEKYIPKCIDSLLGQTYKNLEIIVVDDGSTDKTAEIVKKYESNGVSLLRQDHLGPGKARNLGAENAKGEILILVDSDMEFEPNYIEELIKPIVSGEEIGTCHGLEKTANVHSLIARCWGKPPDGRVKMGPRTGKGTVFRAIEKSVFASVGGFDFDSSLGYADDHALFYKLKRHAVHVPTAVCLHNNPETLAETYRQAKWIGKSYSIKYPPYLKMILLGLARLSFPLIILFPYYAIPYLIGFLYPALTRFYRSKDLKYALVYCAFQIVESFGLLVGYTMSVFRLGNKAK